MGTLEKAMTDKPKDAPEDCVGTDSELAGKADSCAGCPNQTICSTKPKGPDPDIEILKRRLAPIKNIILVLSGKGGVGKSTFSVNLARALAAKEFQVGLLDIDICGPSIPKMLGVEGETVHKSSDGWSPVYTEDEIALMSMGFLLDSDDKAVIWRGPKKDGQIKMFLKDVCWEELDYLVVDTPPGTSDEHLSVVQYIKNSAANVGTVLVTTPQDVALLDVRKELDFCRRVSMPILGIVENMSGFICPKCKNSSVIFPATSGGAEGLCKEFKIPFLGRVPIDPRLAKSCDEGENIFAKHPDSEVVKALHKVITEIVK